MTGCITVSTFDSTIATLPPASTVTLIPISTPMRNPTTAATPLSSKADSGMGGRMTIRGVVKDDSGKLVSNVYVKLQVYGEAGGWDIGMLANKETYTDETGSYSFDNIIELESGHYELWFNGGHQYGKSYESSGYFIEANEIRNNIHVFNVIVHPVTGSFFSGIIKYEDFDGSIKNFYFPPFNRPEPGHVIILLRGKMDNIEYDLGTEYGKISGEKIEWSGLAGGFYLLDFTYRRLDGVLVQCKSPVFEILPESTYFMEYTIRDCPPSDDSVLS